MVWLRIPMQAETHAAPCQIYFLTSDAKQFCVSMQFALEEDLQKKRRTNKWFKMLNLSNTVQHVMISENYKCILTQKDPGNWSFITKKLQSNCNPSFSGYFKTDKTSKVKQYETKLWFVEGVFYFSRQLY